MTKAKKVTKKRTWKPSKGFIKRQEFIRQNVGLPLVLPGEPLLYSVKYALGERRHSVQYFRDKKFRSFLRCWFPEFKHQQTPVVLLICFYVNPLPYHELKITAAQLRSEKVPAAYSWELFDFTLSFMEMLRGVLFNCYSQIVKLDVVKFYSNDPRTVFQFMHWETYVNVQNNYPMDAKAESVVSAQPRQKLQSKRKGDGIDDPVCENEITPRLDRASAIRAATRRSSLSIPSAEDDSPEAARALAHFTACMPTGRGQPRKVSKRCADKGDVEG